MRIQLHELRHQLEQRLDFHEQVDLSRAHPNVAAEASIHVQGSARYKEGRYEINGKLSTTLKLICSKCLTHYDWPLEAEWHEVFVDEASEHGKMGDEEEEIHIIRDNEIELKPYIEAVLLLHIPFVPVCHEGCQGLCPLCGINRNDKHCECKQETIDPRLAELEKFFSAEDRK